MAMGYAQFLWGLSSGILVLGISGAFWWGLALGPRAQTAGPGALAAVVAVQVGGVVCFAYLARALRRRSGFRRASLDRRDPATRRVFRGFRLALALELAMVLTGIALCLLFDRRDLIWPSVGLTVSLHFAPLGRLFHVRAYYLTAALGVVVSTVALLPALGTWRMLWLGLSMCPVMWGTAVYLLITADRLAARAAGVSPPRA